MELHDRDQFDDLLDGALKRYGGVEPRAGLETRVMANLAIAQSRAPGRRRWLLGFAIAACACTALFIGVMSLRRPSRHVIDTAGEQTTPDVGTRSSVGTAAAKTAELPTSRSPRRHRRSEPRSEARANPLASASPRLSQFPAPRPLSEQERMLKAYVDEFPEEAALVAKEQAEREKEVEAFLSDQNTGSNLNQER